MCTSSIYIDVYFLLRDAIPHNAERGICYVNSVCPSVCLSVIRVHCIKTAERIPLSDRPIILLFRYQRLLRKSDGFALWRGRRIQGDSDFSNIYQYAAISRKR